MNPYLYIQFLPIVLFFVLTPTWLTIPPSTDSVTKKKQIFHNPFKSDIYAAAVVHTIVFALVWLTLLHYINKKLELNLNKNY